MEQFNFDAFEQFTKIVVIGVGGGGCNAVNHMIDEKLQGVTFWVANTDAQALANSKCENRLILGKDYTFGLGAGGNPDVGAAAANASENDIREICNGANMVFIASGMGGGTGTGATPIVAKIARESGALTIAIVTRPFEFEGETRKENAISGIAKTKDNVDTMIVVSNEKLMRMSGNSNIIDVFAEADKVLAQSVRTVVDLIITHGLINVDFADVRTALTNKGVGLIGFGVGKGENKVIAAASSALACPLLESSISGAKNLLVNVTGGSKVSLDEVKAVVDNITNAIGNPKNIRWGLRINNELEDDIMVSLIATEFDTEYDPSAGAVIEEEVAPQVEEEEVKEEPKKEEEKSILPSFFRRG